MSAEMLVFDEDERGLSDTPRYHFEAVARLPEHEQDVVRCLLDAVIVKNQVAGAIERVTTAAKARTSSAKKTPTKKASGKRFARQRFQ